MLTVEEAQALAVAGLGRVGVERVPLDDALDRVLAVDVASAVDAPAWPSSMMDGFAVRSGTGSRLRVVGESAAGRPFGGVVGDGEAAAVMTGAVVPDGADAVVMVEDTERDGDWVLVKAPLRAGQYIRKVAEDLRTGQVVAVAGSFLGPAQIGILAGARCGVVTVFRRPSVAIVSTGDELRESDQPLGPGQIPDSNSLMLAALVRRAGGSPWCLPLVGDELSALRGTFSAAMRADVVISTGGVSVGAHDHVKDAIAGLGGTLDAWRVNMKPGKPVALARLGSTPVFGLPGNPASAFVAFWLFVRPALRTLGGFAQPFDLPTVKVRLAAPLAVRSDRRQYLRGRVAVADGVLAAQPMARQGSHQLTSMTGANALLVVQPGDEAVAGAVVDAVMLGPLQTSFEDV